MLHIVVQKHHLYRFRECFHSDLVYNILFMLDHIVLCRAFYAKLLFVFRASEAHAWDKRVHVNPNTRPCKSKQQMF